MMRIRTRVAMAAAALGLALCGAAWAASIPLSSLPSRGPVTGTDLTPILPAGGTQLEQTTIANILGYAVSIPNSWTGVQTFAPTSAASPAAVIEQFSPSVAAGATDTAGVATTLAGSQGTGAGAGGSIVFEVAPAGATGTAQNALVPALTIDSTKNVTIAGLASAATQCVQVTAGGLLQGAAAACGTGLIEFDNPSTATPVAPSTPLPICPVNASGACIDMSAPSVSASTNASTTITTGGTAQVALAANTARKGCFIENPSTATETLYVEVGSAAFAAASAFSLSPGATFNCASPSGLVITDELQVEGATTGHAFVLVSQ